VVIDGGKRTIQLIGSDTGKPIITVKNGVTLTLRNITLKDTISSTAFLVVVESGGNLILETGAVINTAVGGTISIVPGTTPGTYDEVHIFRADGAALGGQAMSSLIFNQPTRPAAAEVLVVAGGGGAGRYIHVPSYPITADSITVKTGAGGAKTTGAGSKGGTGGNSEFDSRITAPGGGGGVNGYASPNIPGNPGGSGGGGMYSQAGGAAVAGTVPGEITAENLGNRGGNGNNGSGHYFSGAGGGGAGGHGVDTSGSRQATAGGAGVTSSISGTATEYARGGNAKDYTEAADGTNAAKGKAGSGTVIVRFLYPGVAP
jgi:hypothetical protein